MKWTGTAASQFGKPPAALLALRGVFGLLDGPAPALASKLALGLFLRPPSRVKARLPQDWRSGATALKVKGFPRLAAWTWGSGPRVLLVHGWGGRGSQMHSFVPSLVGAGMQAVAFDGPAHGESPGAQTDMVEFSRAIHAVADESGDLEAIVAHSFGAACTLIALRDHPIACHAVALISCPPTGIWVTEQFGKALNVSPGVLRGMRDRLEKKHNGRLQWENLSMVNMVSRLPMPALLVHDRDDRVVPYAEGAMAFTSELSGVSNLTTEGYGHRRLLSADLVVDRVRDFVQKQGRRAHDFSGTGLFPPDCARSRPGDRSPRGDLS